MNLLITGVTGFVGRNCLLRALTENTYDEIWVPVRSLERLQANFKLDGFEGIPSRVKPIVTAAPDWDLSSISNVDHVIHSAGVLFARTDEEYRGTNVKGTLELFSRLPSLPSKAVVLSSQAAVGPCPNDVNELTELDQANPITAYGRSKLAMEQELLKSSPDLNVIFLRPPMVLGPRDQATLPLFKMVKSPLFFKAGLKNKFYSFISVFDLVSAIFSCLDHGGDWKNLNRQAYFVSSAKTITDQQLICETAKASNRRGVLVRIPQPIVKAVAKVVDRVPAWRKAVPTLSGDRAKEVWPDRWVVSNKRFRDAFAWQPIEVLNKTLRLTREWYQKSGQL